MASGRNEQSPRRIRRALGAILVSAALVATVAPIPPLQAVFTAAATVSDSLFYTRYCGGLNVKKVPYSYDGTTFSLGTPAGVATTNGADGIIFAPDGDLLVGGQGDRVHKVDPTTGTVTTRTAGGTQSYHLALDFNGLRFWSAGIPGALAEVPLNPFANGVARTLSGDDTSITSISFDNAGNGYYTASNSGGHGNFGRINLATFTTQRVMTNVAAAHGMAFDKYTGHLMLFGDSHVTQIDPATMTVVSDRAFPNLGFDQGTVDGSGHAFVASNNGYLLFIDYYASQKIGDPSNVVTTPYLDSCLDDVAPLSGLGAPLSIVGSRSPAANADGWNNTAVNVTFTCDGGFPPLNCQSPVTVMAEGAGQSVTGHVTDSKGNSDSTTVDDINIDLTKPSVTGSRMPAANGNGWNNTDVTVSFACTDALSGVKSCSGPVTLSTEGSGQSAGGNALDKAGNTNTTQVTDINIDKTAPSISASRAPAANAYGWNNTPVAISFTCTDALSGIDSCPSPVTLSAEGTNLGASGTATDRAGNSASATLTGVNIDLTAPSVTAARVELANPDGWNNTDVTVTFACADTLSGVDTCPAPVTVSTEGSGQSVSGTASDQAGNTATVTLGNINIDKGMPMIVGSRTPAANAAGWNNSPVTVSFACSDALSGIADCSGPTTLSGEGAGQSVSGQATDKAGNSASATVDNINIDLTPPTISASRTPDANGYGWNNSPVTVSFACADALSGVAMCPADVVLSGEGDNQGATGTVMDNAGNSASATLGGIMIDLTPPAVTYTGNAGTYDIHETVTITCTATDALSGIDTHTCADLDMPAYLLGLGDHSLSAGATDRAGNSASGSTTFTVQVTFGGLCELVHQLVPHHGIANSLCQKLRAAAAAHDRGQHGTMNNILEAFQHEVEAQRGKHITPENADILIDLAEMLKM